ncbi:hypothetical protein E3N88_37943 [Mikania micrantha]|uniref:Uncharacterized protein n=1 Tax=Mikania micrantha TaxID=192012 RepID=A0A5N6LSJ6_9ASTR|nr:hypothetical protein E3N88_37943 [Mikania micrantha]
MKQIVAGGGGRLRSPTEEEAEVAEILLTLPKIIEISEFLRRRRLTWGSTKKRSVLDSKEESSPSPEKVTAVEAGESPSTPLCFLPSGSGSDGSDKRKPPSSVKKNFKRKATDDLMENYCKMQQEKEILLKETKAMKTLHQELTSANLELKAIIQKVNYSRNIIDHQSYHQQNAIFVPPTPQRCQQLMVSSSGNSHSGGNFGLFNQIDPRVKIHGETFDFLASSQPLDQSKYCVMDNDPRVRTAAAARKMRMLRMKENKKALLALKLSSRGC